MMMHELHDADAEAKRRAMERPERLTRRQAREAEDRAAAEGAQDKDHDGQEEQDV